MKRLGRLIFDLLGISIAVVSLILAIYVITGSSLTTLFDKPDDAFDSVKEYSKGDSNKARTLIIVAIVMSSLSILMLIPAVLMLFKRDGHFFLTAFIWILAIIALITSIVGYTDGKEIWDKLKEASNDITASLVAFN